MKPNDKAIEAAINKYNKLIGPGGPVFHCFLRAALDAAYAAQFQSEEYAGLVARLKNLACELASVNDAIGERFVEINEAADALEAVLAERDALKAEKQKWWEAANDFDEDANATLWSDIADEQHAEYKKALDKLNAITVEFEAERDSLKAELAAANKRAANRLAVEAELDALKKWKEEDSAAMRVFERYRELEAERDALAARLAPVEDEALVEIVAKHFIKENKKSPYTCWKKAARDAIAAIRPHIEAAERERCAKIAEHLNGWGSDFGKGGHAMHIAAAIRSGK